MQQTTFPHLHWHFTLRALLRLGNLCHPELPTTVSLPKDFPSGMSALIRTCMHDMSLLPGVFKTDDAAQEARGCGPLRNIRSAAVRHVRL